LRTDGGGGGVGVRRLAGTGDECFKFVADSFGSDAARVFTVGNWVVITPGLVVLFERNVGGGGGLGILFNDDDAGVGIGGGLLVTLKILVFIIEKSRLCVIGVG
jgi:hypothetical protein